jgi:hypothetical protein
VNSLQCFAWFMRGDRERQGEDVVAKCLIQAVFWAVIARSPQARLRASSTRYGDEQSRAACIERWIASLRSQ